MAPEYSSLGEFCAVELSDLDATAAALDWALGLGPVSRLVNNVGVVMPALLEDTSLEDFDALMALNVRCAIQCTQALAPAMRHRGMGRIVNIASRSALGKALRTNYSASKAALIGLTRTWSLELAADGITVNCICPGPIATELYKIANPADDPRNRQPSRRPTHHRLAGHHPRRAHRHPRRHRPSGGLLSRRRLRLH